MGSHFEGPTRCGTRRGEVCGPQEFPYRYRSAFPVTTVGRAAARRWGLPRPGPALRVSATRRGCARVHPRLDCQRPGRGAASRKVFALEHLAGNGASPGRNERGWHWNCYSSPLYGFVGRVSAPIARADHCGRGLVGWAACRSRDPPGAARRGRTRPGSAAKGGRWDELGANSRTPQGGLAGCWPSIGVRERPPMRSLMPLAGSAKGGRGMTAQGDARGVGDAAGRSPAVISGAGALIGSRSARGSAP